MATTTTPTGPSTAERVRSSCARTHDAVLAIEGSSPTATTVHHMLSTGDVVVTVPTESAAATMAWLAADGGLPAVLELTDTSPLQLREPVRSLVWLRGNLDALCDAHTRELADEVASEFPHPQLLDVGHTTVLLRLQLASAVVADSAGAEPVRPDQLLCATADPFWEMEDIWLRHLDEDHPDLIARLSQKLPPSMRRGRVRPLGINRYGVNLRVETEDGDRDIRMPFAEPADDATSLSRAIRLLVGCPFVNGLRARG